MLISEFRIGEEFYSEYGSGELRKWRCTDIGTRTILAIRIDRAQIAAFDPDTMIIEIKEISQKVAEDCGWFNGPPYGVCEIVFDEYDLDECYIDEDPVSRP